MRPRLRLTVGPILKKYCVTKFFSSKSADFDKALINTINQQRVEFQQLYASNDSQNDAEPLGEWMQTYYRRPRPDLVIGAFAHGLFASNKAFIGNGAFPSVVFLSHVLKQSIKDKEIFVKFLKMVEYLLKEYRKKEERLSNDSNSDQEKEMLQVAGAEQFDTVLRAIYLSQLSFGDEYLKSVSTAWLDGLEKVDFSDKNAEYLEFSVLAKSIYPVEFGLPARMKLADIPIPSLNLTKFEKHVKENILTVYNSSRYLHNHIYAGYLLANNKSASKVEMAKFSLYSPDLALLVTKSLVDGYWAEFYATSSPRMIEKVLDVGTLYVKYLEEFGDKYVTEYRGVFSSNNDTNDEIDYSKIPSDIAQDPIAKLEFESSRYALWTFLVNASTHTNVCEEYFRSLSNLQDKVIMENPLSHDDTLTAFGKQRLELLQLLFPAMSELGKGANDFGIGSGKWPERYLEDGGKVSQIADNNSGQSSHHSVPASSSMNVVNEKTNGTDEVFTGASPVDSRNRRIRIRRK
jgi:hypothetical protein